jgi:hypothetical protein
VHIRLGVGWLAAATLTFAASPSRELLDRYCVTCHSQRLKTGGLSLEKLEPGTAASQAEVWEKVIRKLRSRTMPPPGLPRPDNAAYDSLASFLESQIDQAAAMHPYAGRPVLHRLNRTEYANAIRDLLALDVDATTLLPPDDSAFGFDNIADVLGVSPSLQERYLAAALKIAALAVGDPKVAPGSETWRIRQDVSQNRHLEGLPLGTAGGILIHYNFPLDAEYSFQAKLYRTNLNIMRGLESTHQVEFSIDGRRIHTASMGGADDLASLFKRPTETGDAVDARLRVRVPVKAGPHDVVVTFVEAPQEEGPVRLQPYVRSSVDNFDWSGLPHLQTVTVAGPFDATGPGDTPSRRRIFVCSGGSPACTKQILSNLIRRAYRQTPSETDLGRAMSFYEGGGGGDAGIELALARILASPKFVFRVEREPAASAPNGLFRVGDFDLASRLSFFLWSSIPDEALLRSAADSKLHDPAVLDREVRRMLADPRAEALVTNFAGQWLQLRNLRNVQPNSDLFPDFDDNLRQAFRRETEFFFKSILVEDRSVLDLLTADYTYVNERLAQHYGIPDIYGSRFRRVTLTAEERKGLLGKGSILALTSHAERTSPVLRGKWILENILGTPVPPPPPDVPPLKPNEEGQKPRTLREQMVEHRVNPVCASCHKVMDPIGFSLENFDAVGAWRTEEAGGRIDATGELADGTKVDGIVALRQAVLSRPELFVGTLTEKLLTYALGRGLDYRDMPAVRAIVREAASNNYRFSSIISGVVHSTPFQMRTAEGEKAHGSE